MEPLVGRRRRCRRLRRKCVGAGQAATTDFPAPTGVAWSRVPHDEDVFDGALINSVTAGGPGLVAVGSAGWPEGSAGAVWTSVDGLTWSRVPHDEAVFGGEGESRINDVTVGGPGLVAVGSQAAGHDEDAVVWTSADGITWSRIPHDEAVFGGEDSQGVGMNSVASTASGLVAVGDLGHSPVGVLSARSTAVWTSADGLTWSRLPHDEAMFGEDYGSMVGVVAADSGIVAVGGHGARDDLDAAVWVAATED